jgi:NAD(P)-dependent dehydrogenase (short-subunit alcohol dehydrogenase family)
MGAMSFNDTKSVLITGCSTGIGRALAEEFARRGQRVFATARRVEALAGLEGDGIEKLALDVTDAGSIARAVAHVIESAGRIDLLINNAGKNTAGPLCELPLDEVRGLFETNVVGLLAVTQAVFPHMARARRGRIVNIGSVVGILPTPFGGVYCASKSAVHMLSEVLRMEAAPFGVEVVLVQPGGVRSSISDNAEQGLARYAQNFELYRPFAESIAKRARASQATGPMDTAAFARRLVAQLLRRRAPRVIRLGAGARVLPRLADLPGALRDAALSRRFGLQRGRIED